MKIKDFSLHLTAGCESADAYVSMEHGAQYALVLGNNCSSRADVEVTIDGHKVGEWRLNGFTTVTIERPVHDTGKFTFYQFGTIESSKAGIVQNAELGLVKAVFKPECQMLRSGRSGLGPGGTGLSGDSEQQFYGVAALDTNPAEFITIHLRLGVIAHGSGIRPVYSLSNEVPPPL
jgi:hypothetical protein